MPGASSGGTKGRGFTALSEIKAEAPPPAATIEPTPQGEPEARPAAAAVEPPEHDQRNVLSKPSSPHAKGPVIAGAVVAGIILMALINFASQGTRAPTPASPPPASPQPVMNEPAPASFSESKPMPGTDLVLTPDEIRYCLAEGIRLDGSRESLDKSSSADVERFNDMIDDYNSRCSSFRYRTGTLQAIRAQVEQRRSSLEADGYARFSR